VTETTVPVAIKLNSGQVGYLLFNDLIATSEKELVDAVSQLQGVSDLVLDLRYNSGGYQDIAAELAYMIAGPGPTSSGTATFESIKFNDKYSTSTTNPATGAALTPTVFHNTTQGFSLTAGQALPHLDLQTVYVLTGPETCSASEAIINGLRGVNVNVVEIGSTTCGKPYGYYPRDNCGTTYFTIQFAGVNALGFGDYAGGFSPQNTTSGAGVAVPGCSVADDFSHNLGDPQEGQLSVALAYRTNPMCPSPTGFSSTSIKRAVAPGPTLTMDSPLKGMRILGH